MKIKRRNFFTACAGAAVAPVIAKAAVAPVIAKAAVAAPFVIENINEVFLYSGGIYIQSPFMYEVKTTT